MGLDFGGKTIVVAEEPGIIVVRNSETGSWYVCWGEPDGKLYLVRPANTFDDAILGAETVAGMLEKHERHWRTYMRENAPHIGRWVNTRDN